MTEKSRSRIPAEESTDFVRWEPPRVEGSGASVQNGRMYVRPMTAGVMDSIRNDAFEAGYQDGRKEGEEQGYQDGLIKGGEEGRTRGFEQGVSDGREQGYKDKVAEIELELSQHKTLMESFLLPFKKNQDLIEEALLNVVLSISRAVIKRELEIDSQQIVQVVREAIHFLPDNSSQSCFYLNPVDMPFIQELISGLTPAPKIIETAEILAGGCRIEASQSIIDATIEKRFQKVVQSLLKKQLSSNSESDTVDLADAIEDMSDFQRELLDTEIEGVQDVSSDLDKEIKPEEHRE